MRIARALATALAAASGMIGPGLADPLACQAAGAEPAHIERITPEGSILLRDGRELLPAHLAAEDQPGTWRRNLAGWLDHQIISWKPAGPADRWGRIPANLFLQEPDGVLPAFWVQAGLVHHGHAALWPARMPAECLRLLRREEAGAIAGQRGRWATDRQAANMAWLGSVDESRFGASVVLVLAVKDTRPWHGGMFVNFMPSFRGGPSVFLTSRQVEALRNAQRDPSSWPGKRLLLRSILGQAGLRRLRIESIDQLLPID